MDTGGYDRGDCSSPEVFLLPSDYFSTQRTDSVLQQVEKEQFNDISANDSFKAASRYWVRIDRPEQLPAALMRAMETLTDPATTGGGVVYSSASKVLAEFAEKTGIPVGSTQAGKGALAL